MTHSESSVKCGCQNNADLGCIDRSLTCKAWWGYNAAQCLSLCTWSTVSNQGLAKKNYAQKREQDVTRLGTMSYQEILKEAEGFAPGVQGNCLHKFEELSNGREIRLIFQDPTGWKGDLWVEILE